MPLNNSENKFLQRKTRYNISISPISGLESYIQFGVDDGISRCIVWNVSSTGACLLLNGKFSLRAGDQCQLKCISSFEKIDYVCSCVVRWSTPEVFVTFVGVSFEHADSSRDAFFNNFVQTQ